MLILEQLKKYGYFPGFYSGECSSCLRIRDNMDKLAVTCYDCAENMYSIDMSMYDRDPEEKLYGQY